MLIQSAVTLVGTVFLIFAFIAFSAYMRIIMYLQALDAGMENPPVRAHMGDKLRAYKEFCLERGKKPILLFIYATGVIGAVVSWLPLPWLVLR